MSFLAEIWKACDVTRAAPGVQRDIRVSAGAHECHRGYSGVERARSDAGTVAAHGIRSRHPGSDNSREGRYAQIEAPRLPRSLSEYERGSGNLREAAGIREKLRNSERGSRNFTEGAQLISRGIDVVVEDGEGHPNSKCVALPALFLATVGGSGTPAVRFYLHSARQPLRAFQTSRGVRPAGCRDGC